MGNTDETESVSRASERARLERHKVEAPVKWERWMARERSSSQAEGFDAAFSGAPTPKNEEEKKERRDQEAMDKAKHQRRRERTVQRRYIQETHRRGHAQAGRGGKEREGKRSEQTKSVGREREVVGGRGKKEKRD